MGQGLRQAKGLSQLPSQGEHLMAPHRPSSLPGTNVFPGTDDPRLWQAQACAVITRRIYSKKCRL